MSLANLKFFKEFEEGIERFSNSFVPYLYLDGHRSSNIGNSDSEKYESGLKFFIRFTKILKKLGFKNLVTMVHTSRNCNVKGRIDSIHSAIQKSFVSLNKEMNDSTFKLFGDIESYKSNGRNDLYNFLIEIEKNTLVRNASFTHHILINYSENWAINNLEKISSIPPVSSVIRFTKGFVSGGWIPIKMQETTFVYSQIPSVSEFWSDEAIETLILIALKNWSSMTKYIGKKEYAEGEKEIIHTARDIELSLCVNKLNIKNTMQNRIIAFGIDGPVIYEL